MNKPTEPMETLLKRHGMAPLGDDTREDRAYCEGFNNALKLGDEGVAQLQMKIVEHEKERECWVKWRAEYETFMESGVMSTAVCGHCEVIVFKFQGKAPWGKEQLDACNQSIVEHDTTCPKHPLRIENTALLTKLATAEKHLHCPIEILPDVLSDYASRLAARDRACAELRGLVGDYRVFLREMLASTSSCDHALSTSAGEDYVHKDELEKASRVNEKIQMERVEERRAWQEELRARHLQEQRSREAE